MDNGKKEGRVIVKDEDGHVFRVLQFKNDLLNGLCEFYSRGRLIEKRMFLNDKEEGWSCEITRGRETRWFLYSSGVRIAELKKCDDMVDYWKAIDLSVNTVLSICKYDSNHKPTDKGYIYVNNWINRVVLYENGIESVLLKTFDEKRMVEFDNNGNQVYKGGYADSIVNDYPRDGDGIQYDKGKIVYEGSSVKGKREGEGCSYKDDVIYCEGEWKEGKPDGEGWLSVNNEVYEGKWVKGVYSLGMNHWYDYFGGRVIKNENELRELLKNDDEKKGVSELVIEKGCGNDIKDVLGLCYIC